MLRFLYTLCEILAWTCALASPVAVIHWLAKITKVPMVEGLISALDRVFLPLNALLDGIIKSPPLQYDGNQYDTTQGLLAIILTLGFFALTFISESLKTSEQQLDVSHHAREQKIRLRKLKEEQDQRQQQSVSNRRILLYVKYDVHLCPPGAMCMERAYAQHGGIMHGTDASALRLEFDTVMSAFQYCLEVSQAILAHYATLRPMDPHPPFRMGLHSVDAAQPESVGYAELQKLIECSGDNQIFFSQTVKNFLEAKDLLGEYRYQSMGLHTIEGGSHQQEIFRLFPGKPNNSL